MEPSDLTIEVLKSIRDEVRATNERMDGLRDDVHATNGRIDALRADTQQGFSEVSRRIVESDVRTATAITDLAGTVRDMTAVLRAQHDLRPRLEQCERDIDALKRRAG
jgi:uncharacterized protein Yka (UPF0111/DUF47 family)